MDKKPTSLNENKGGATSRSVPKRPTDSYHARSAPSDGPPGPGKRDKKEKLSQSLKEHPPLMGPPEAMGASGGGGGGAGPNTKDSPDSGSLYSNDEIPSGYNSGEQYDTLSTGKANNKHFQVLQ